MPDTNGIARPESCGACRFFTPPATGARGFCRRFPAVERKEAGDWCGCFESAGTKPTYSPALAAPLPPAAVPVSGLVEQPAPSTRTGRQRRKGGQ